MEPAHWGYQDDDSKRACGYPAAFVLTACGGKPSDSDSKEAVTELLKQSGVGEVTDVKDFGISGCTKAEGMDGYRCDTRGTFTISVMGRTVPIPVNKNFRYAKGGWHLARLRPVSPQL